MTTETMEAQTETTTEVETKRRGRVADRDFTKASDMHNEFAQYVNAQSGLTFLSGKHIKAVLALYPEFVKSPEHQAKLALRKEERAAEKEKQANEKAARNAQYDGMTKDQIKAIKKADRLEQQAADARAEVDRLRGQ